MRKSPIPSLAFGAAILFAVPADATHPVDTGNHRQVSAGKTVYLENCAECHGENLRGPVNPAKFPKKLIPPRLDERGHGSHHSDRYMFNRISAGSEDKSGKPIKDGMPAFGFRLHDAQIWAVISYIKSRWPASLQRKQNALNPGHGPENKKTGGQGRK